MKVKQQWNFRFFGFKFELYSMIYWDQLSKFDIFIQYFDRLYKELFMNIAK